MFQRTLYAIASHSQFGRMMLETPSIVAITIKELGISGKKTGFAVNLGMTIVFILKFR